MNSPASEPRPVISLERSARRAVVALSGELDMLVEAEIVQTVTDTAALRGLTALHLDLSEVTFIDSSGLRSLLLSRHAVLDRGLKFSLSMTEGGPVHRLLVLAGAQEELAAELV